MLKRLARATLKPLSAGVDLIRPPRSGVTVLIYHRVGAQSGSEVDLDTAVFEAQMSELADARSVISLDEAVTRLLGAQGDAEPAVVITFDDGTPDVVETALPILERLRLPMTLYVATDFVEAGLGFWDPSERALSWSALRDAVSTGLVGIGSHTHTHALLDRLAPSSIEDELDRSIELIGERLELRAQHFAYPKALRPNAAADAAVRARFRSAAIAGTRPNPYGATDIHLLNRTPIQRSDHLHWFRRKAAGGMGLEDRVRDVVNRRRYADATR